MTEDQYIQSVRENNRALFNAPEIVITPKSLEAALRHAFRAGLKAGTESDNAFGKFLDTLKGAR